MKFKKVVSMSLICAVVLSFTAFASAAENTEPYATIEGSAVPAPNVGFEYRGIDDTSDAPYAVVSPTVDAGEYGIEPYSVTHSTNLNLSVGNNWSYSFNTWVAGAEDHNTFNVVTNNMSGKYKILVVDDKGYQYETPEFTNQDNTVTVWNASSDRWFTVYILNTSFDTLTGSVRLSSYYD